MSKEQKITDEQLEKITKTNTDLQSTLINIGLMEAQKGTFLDQLTKLNGEMDSLKKELEEEYGAVNINLKDGTFEEISEEQKAELKTV